MKKSKTVFNYFAQKGKARTQLLGFLDIKVLCSPNRKIKENQKKNKITFDCKHEQQLLFNITTQCLASSSTYIQIRILSPDLEELWQRSPFAGIS